MTQFNMIAYCLTWWGVFATEASRGHPLRGLGIATVAGIISALVIPHSGASLYSLRRK